MPSATGLYFESLNLNGMLTQTDTGAFRVVVGENVHGYSGVDFTHGICPACLEQLYPDYAREKRTRERAVSE